MAGEVLASLPRGPHGLGRDVVLASQRRRMLDAMTRAVAEKGFTATTVADVVAGAGVSRKTFYEHFRDRDDCFMSAYEDGLRTLREAMVEATAHAEQRGDDAVEQLRASVRAYLAFLADRPATARTFVLEVLAAGPAALARRGAAYREYADVTRLWHRQARARHPEYREVPDEIYAAVVGAGHGMVTEQICLGRTTELRELEPVLMYVHLALLATDGEAASELQRPVPQRRRPSRRPAASARE